MILVLLELFDKEAVLQHPADVTERKEEIGAHLWWRLINTAYKEVLFRPGTRPTNSISIEFEIRSKFAVLLFKMCSTDHNVTTVLLSWRVQNFTVISWICYEQEHYKISLNFEFDWNIVSRWAWTDAKMPETEYQVKQDELKVDRA